MQSRVWLFSRSNFCSGTLQTSKGLEMYVKSRAFGLVSAGKYQTCPWDCFGKMLKSAAECVELRLCKSSQELNGKSFGVLLSAHTFTSFSGEG